MTTIFVQDSDEDILSILVAVLEEANYKVHFFEDCSELFFKMVFIRRPDLILLDFKLGGLDCIAACKQLKIFYFAIPVIAMSTDFDIKFQCLQLGFNDCLLKPFDLNTLYNTLIRNLQSTHIS